MLHFQTAEQSVLYTGDFRLKRSDLERIKPLKSMSEARSCGAVYVDSTFFSEQWPEFPPQQVSIEKIIDLVRSWVEKSPRHVIELNTPATYGSELLFLRIHQVLGRKIHVSAAVFEQYQYVPDLDGVTTTDPSGLQIHACYGEDRKVCLEESRKAGLVRVIRPSAMIWRQWRTGKDIMQVDNSRTETYRVCYSNHASFSEVRDLLLFLRAKSVYLNVENPARAEEMEALRHEIMKGYSEEAAQESSICPFGTQSGNEFRFSNVQPLTIGRGDALPIDEDFVVVLPKRRRRISATTS
jgi:DNA cross-link repair 1C protein